MDPYTFLELDGIFQDTFKVCHVPNLLEGMRNYPLFAFQWFLCIQLNLKKMSTNLSLSNEMLLIEVA